MKNYVYALYNKLSARYESVMSFPSDGMALYRLDKNIDKKEFELCRVGEISIEDGTVVPCAPIRLVWNTEETLPKTEAE